ncbi:MAG: hypothetical protein AAFX87_30835 [Bacteroidota bacterium]
MRTSQILTRTVAGEFYRDNATFFYLTLMVGVGMIRYQDHVLIALNALVSWELASLLMLLCIAYQVKALNYVVKAKNLPENSFLCALTLFPKATQTGQLLSLQIALLMPVLAYAGFIAAVGIHEGLALSVLIMAGLIFILIAIGYTFCSFQFRPASRDIYLLPNWVSRTKLSLPFYSWDTIFILKERTALFFTTKLFTCLTLILTSHLYFTGGFDARLINAAVLGAFLGNMVILNELQKFNHEQLALLKNLPQSLTKKFGLASLSALMLTIPESVLLLRYYPYELGMGGLIQELLFGWSILLFVYGYIWSKGRLLERLTRNIFYFFVSILVLILYATPPIVMAIVFISGGYVAYRMGYYRYESVVDDRS